MATLNVIGAGRVGRTLAALFARSGIFETGDVLSSTPASTREAVGFIGAGNAADAPERMHAADVWLIATPDRAIRTTCERLAATSLLRPGDIVFHCSGALSSTELGGAAAGGAQVASVHPLKTFASPSEAVQTFAGTPCVAEGDGAALRVLEPAFERIGARLLHIDGDGKTLYHAASVVVCNYLVALLDTGLRCYEQAGLSRDTAAKLIEPIVRETVEHVFSVGPARSLTGPISRGDDAVIARHLEALRSMDSTVSAIYRALGTATVDLAREQGMARPDALARIAALLRG
ncbi:MAG TPA: Rossmann-like and DUF2520 domain-containing protein [Burkholderiales bacterium]|nr:Rossmann-like and DUF2520 domain-containing protein [Burkholderiales bacterium]